MYKDPDLDENAVDEPLSRPRRWTILLAGLALLLLVTGFKWTVYSEPCTVEFARGDVHFRGAPSERLYGGLSLDEGSTIEVGPGSAASLKLPGGHSLAADPGAVIHLQVLRRSPFGSAGRVTIEVESGRAYLSGHGDGRTVTRLLTPTATAGIRGTALALTVTPQETAMSVHQGNVAAASTGREVPLRSGQGSLVAAGQAPQSRSLPDSPRLLTPLPGAELRMADATVSWSEVPATHHYRLEIARDERFVALLAVVSTPATSVAVPALETDGPLYMRLFAVSSEGLESIPTDERAFHYRVHHESGVRLQKAKRYADSIAELRRALSGYPRDPRVHLDLGWTLYLAGRHGDARDFLRNACAIEGENLEARIKLARVLFWLGQVDEAISTYDFILARAPRDADALWGKADALRVLERPQEAIQAARLALELRPGFGYASVTLAECLITMGDDKQARATLIAYLHLPETDTTPAPTLLARARAQALEE